MATYDNPSAQISFAKLDETGTWYVRVAVRQMRRNFDHHPSPGDEVFVRLAKGGSKRVTLGPVKQRDLGAFPGPAVYYQQGGTRGNFRSSNGNKRTWQPKANRQAAVAERDRLREQYRAVKSALSVVLLEIGECEDADSLRDLLSDIERRGRQAAAAAA